MIYLDNAASTPLLPRVKEKLISCLDIYGNPSSLHSEGVAAKRIIIESKEIISKKLNCLPDELYFTSGATMSNSILLQGFDGDIISSEIEHEDILMLQYIRKIPVDNLGRIDLNVLKYLLKNQTSNTLYSIQMANSVIGTIQNIKEISELIHSYPGAFLHVDATQYIPYFKVDVQDLKIDALSMSGQKIGCIKGTGLLYVSNKLINYVTPIILGKQGLIGGTENVIGIACLGEAFANLDYDTNKMVCLRNKLIDGLDGALVGDLENRLPNNALIKFSGVNNLSMVMMLNEYGICCSAGSACSSGDATPSATLLAIGLTPEEANECVRFTLGKNTTEEEINETIKTVNSVYSLLKEI